MKKFVSLLTAATFVLPMFAIAPVQALASEEDIANLPLVKPIERSYDLEHRRARRLTPRRAWWLYNPFKTSSTTQSRINTEEPGNEDVLAPGERVYQDLQFKNRRRKAYLNNKRAYDELVQKPEVPAARRWVKPPRRNRPKAYSLNSERSGADKLRKLLGY